VVGFVRPGEWTTYGDVSTAVTGHRHCARFVGNLAAADDRFPHAQRVLRSGGTVADSPVRNSQRVMDKLVKEGVRFRGRRADPSQQVHWDELARRSGTDRPSAGRTPPRSRRLGGWIS
ncbi:MAG: hypothetical protein ABI571_04505, partial [Actinomycetota bacterium]